MKIRKLSIHIWHLLFSIFFTGMLVLSRHVVNLEVDSSTIDTTYVIDFHWFDIVIFLLLLPFCYLVTEAISHLSKIIEEHIFLQERNNKWWIVILFTVVIFICWIPYLMSFRPGGIYFDTVESLDIALGKTTMNNHNPVLYTLLWKLVFWLTGVYKGDTVYQGFNAFTELQCVFLAGGLSVFIYLCYKWGMNKKGIILMVLIAALFPMYPFYGISLWKDTIFCLTVFLFALYLYNLFRQQKDNVSVGQLIIYAVFLLLTAFLRNNGIYVIAVLSLVLFFVCFKESRKIAVKIGIVSAAAIIICAVILGPVFTKCGYNIDTKSESMGIPIQQVAYIISTDGNLEGIDTELLDGIMPLDQWREKFNPTVADNIKFDPEFDKAYFEQNANAFFKEYLHLVAKNPVKAVKAYLLSTLGFWDISESSPVAYINNFHFSNADYFISDYFDYYLDFSFANIVEPKKYISAAVMVWLMLFTVCECLSKKNYKGLIPIAPTFGIWMTIMIATPIAFSFRYVYALFLCIPLYLLIIFDCNRSIQIKAN